MKRLFGCAFLAAALLGGPPVLAQSGAGQGLPQGNARSPATINVTRPASPSMSSQPSFDSAETRQFVHKGQLYTVDYNGRLLGVEPYRGQTIRSAGVTFGSGGQRYNPMTANRAPMVSVPGRGFDMQAALRQQRRQPAVGTYGQGLNPAISVSIPADTNAILPMGGAYGYGGTTYYGYPYYPFYGTGNTNSGLFPYSANFPIPANATPGTPLPGQVPISGAVLFGPAAGYTTFTSPTSAAGAVVPTSSGGGSFLFPTGTVTPTSSGSTGTIGTGTVINGTISTGPVNAGGTQLNPNGIPVIVSPTTTNPLVPGVPVPAFPVGTPAGTVNTGPGTPIYAPAPVPNVPVPTR